MKSARLLSFGLANKQSSLRVLADKDRARTLKHSIQVCIRGSLTPRHDNRADNQLHRKLCHFSHTCSCIKGQLIISQQCLCYRWTTRVFGCHHEGWWMACKHLKEGEYRGPYILYIYVYIIIPTSASFRSILLSPLLGTSFMRRSNPCTNWLRLCAP
jgi:hypothetical protein